MAIKKSDLYSSRWTFCDELCGGIAEVLSEMERRLEALEQLREKTRALKRGMMQELLTGRTRLV